MLHHLRDSSIARANIEHPGWKKVVQLLDDFALGTSHLCLVLEVMGRSVQDRADYHPGGRLPRTAREVLHQVVLGLNYLWKYGVESARWWPVSVFDAALSGQTSDVSR